MKLTPRAAAFLLAMSVQSAAASNAEYAKIHTIGVISALGGRIDMRKEGLTVFENADYKLDLDLNLDEQIVRQIETSLQPQFIVTKAEVDPGALSELEIGLFEQGRLQRQLLALPNAGKVDAYIVVRPSLAADRGGLVADNIAGNEKMGPVLRGLFGGPFAQVRDTVTAVSALYAVGVYDAATGRQIDYGIAHYPSTHSLLGREFPTAVCDNTIWADTEGAMSDEQKARLKKELSSLVSRSIAYALASAGLIDKSQVGAITAGFDTEGDPACHSPS